MNRTLGVVCACLLSFAFSAFAQPKTFETAPIVTAGGAKVIPILIQSANSNVKSLAQNAFSAHGGFEVLGGGDVSFVFDFKPDGKGGVLLRILSSDGKQEQYREKVTRSSLAQSVLRACDVAVEKTLVKPGFFAGMIAFVGEKSGHREIYYGDMFFSEVRRLTSDRSNSLNPSLSPNGQWLIYTGYYKTGFPDLFKINLSTGKRNVFANYEGTNMGGVFNPNGKWVASIFSNPGNPELYLSTPDLKSVRRLTRNRSVEASPTWSPDGTELIIMSDRLGGPQLFKIAAKGGAMRRIPTNISGYCSEPDWNPRDKNLVAFTAATGVSFQIALYNFSKKEGTFLTKKGGVDSMEPCWTRDGRHLIFTRRDGSQKSLWILDSETGKSKRLHSTKFGSASQADYVYLK